MVRPKESLKQIRKESSLVPGHHSGTGASGEGPDSPSHSTTTAGNAQDAASDCDEPRRFSYASLSMAEDPDNSPSKSSGKSARDDERQEKRPATGRPETNPMTRANVISKIFFWWMLKFFRVGYRRPLVEEDLYDVIPQDSSAILVQRLEIEWDKEIAKSKRSGKEPSLAWALTRMFGWRYMKFGLPALLEESLFKILQPLMLGQLVLYFSTDLVSSTEAYLYAGGIAVCALLTMMCHHWMFFSVARVGMQVRVACSSLIYRKALRLSHLAMGQTTVGQLVNILSNDVNRFDLAFIFLHYLWIAPIQLVVVTVLIWREIGVSCLAGLPILLLLTPLQAYLGRLFSRLRAKTALLSDVRIRIMNEVISGMRVIKIYAWEPSFGRLVSQARKKEIAKILHAAYLRAFTLAFFFVAPLLITFSTFVVYAALGNPVLPSKVYSVIPMFYAVRLCTALFVPFAVMNGTEGLVSIRRIKNFLLMDEVGDASEFPEISGVDAAGVTLRGTALDSNQVQLAEGAPAGSCAPDAGAEDPVESPTPSAPFLESNHSANLPEEAKFTYEANGADGAMDPEPRTSVIVDNLYGSWAKDGSSNVLEGVSFQVKSGELLAVIGPVGCGKSSLLMALLGELPTVSGVEAVSERIGYTAQQPWILSGSVRDNILFGSGYRPAKYEQVIKQCALTRDLELLPDRDQTLVGERGVTLSGGQRARVSLARAVYSEADIFLLDDPLSAVDPAVGRHLFDKCIMGYLSHKPRILVTHQLQFLDKADKILVLKQGKVADYGTFQELQEHGVDFAALLKREEEERQEAEAEEAQAPLASSLERQVSIMSKSSLCSSLAEMEIEEPLIVAPEETAVGNVNVGVYLRYFRAGAGPLLLLVWFIIIIGAQGVLSLADWWLSLWAFSEENAYFAQNVTAEDGDFVLDRDQRVIFIRNYAIMAGVTIVLCFVRSFLFFYICVSASRHLHDYMFNSIIRAPMQFFDSNPVGRILNRFAKDIGFMDELLPATFTDFLQITVMTLAVVIVITVFNPFCLTFTAPILFVFVLIRRYYLASSREVKRLEANARSPVFSHLSATLTGLSTVRAFRAQARFTRAFDAYQDGHTRAWFLFLATTRWFGVQLDALSVVFIAGVSVSSILISNLLPLNSGIVGLSLTYAINLMGAFQWGVRQSAEVENQMTSVERVCQYVDLESEAPLETDHKPPPDWPRYGLITLEAASLRYTNDGPLVLRRIYCCIRPKEKVGIVGRTGAGKSSLMTILMRLAEPTGNIMIDGIDIATIGLHDLRKNVSFIPQDPVLFSGTLRKNLDPFNNHLDADIWRALEEVELKPAIEDLPDKLECALSEGGSNFSVGQRQLLCLARAILRKNKILIVDEATANVDVRTDRLIQATIRQRFKHCTVLTIAHRLNTVMDSDRVLVLDAGRLMEFDEPYVLLQKEAGLFSGMVRETGRSEAEKLLLVAREKYHERNPSDPYGLAAEEGGAKPLPLCTSPTGRRTISIETSL